MSNRNSDYPYVVVAFIGFAVGVFFGMAAQAAMAPGPMTGAEMAAAIADCEEHGLKAGTTIKHSYQTIGINCEPKSP